MFVDKRVCFTSPTAASRLALPRNLHPHQNNTFCDTPRQQPPHLTNMARTITLTTLPNELLDAICAHLTRSVRCTLALTCKATKPSATAALYKVHTNRSHPSDAPFYPFLRTICESPEHGALVKELDIRGWRSEQEVAAGEAWRPMMTGPVEEDERPTRTGPWSTSTDVGSNKTASRFSSTAKGDFNLFLKTAVDIGLVVMPASIDHIPALKKAAPADDTLKADADLIRQLKHGVEDSHFILLVAQLPNLEKLLIEGLTPYPILDWYHFFSCVGTALLSLKILNLWGSRLRTDHKVVKNSLQILDLLPNLEFLQIAYMSAQGHRHTSRDTLPTRKLRVVAFRESAVRHRLFKKITGSQHLESFLYIPGHDAMVADPSAYFSGRQVASYLGSSENSLKFLSSYPMTDLEHPGKCGQL